MKNIIMEKGKPHPGDQCTMCYRCICNCPKQAITLLGSKVIEQYKFENYINLTKSKIHQGKCKLMKWQNIFPFVILEYRIRKTDLGEILWKRKIRRKNGHGF